MSDKKVCLVGSQKTYPAFDSASSILRSILGQNQVSELRIADLLSGCPPLLKVLLYAFQDLTLCLRILSHHKKEMVNAIFLFQAYYPLSSIALKLLSIKLVLFIGGSSYYWSYFEHASSIGKVLTYTNLPIQEICHKCADTLITLSRSMVKSIGLEKYEHKTWFALPRLDREFYSQFRIIKNYRHRSNVIGFVGSLSRRKGVLNFIRAIALISKEKKDFKFLLIGKGPLLENIRTEAQRLEISESVRITGFVDYDDLKRYYNEMKLYVLPAYAEGIPSTIFEAIACGTPVLATRVGGIPDLIKNGQTGFLLKSNGPKHIAGRITQLLDNPKLLEKVSANAHKYVRENFEEKVLESWRKIFHDLGMLVNGKRNH
jgi:glycosyltransferase involved in cell wall biosynthesis